MTFAQRRNRQTTHFSERILVGKRRISVFFINVSVLLPPGDNPIAVNKYIISTTENILR